MGKMGPDQRSLGPNGETLFGLMFSSVTCGQSWLLLRAGRKLFYASLLASGASGIPWLVDGLFPVSSCRLPSLYPNFLFFFFIRTPVILH